MIVIAIAMVIVIPQFSKQLVNEHQYYVIIVQHTLKHTLTACTLHTQHTRSRFIQHYEFAATTHSDSHTQFPLLSPRQLSPSMLQSVPQVKQVGQTHSFFFCLLKRISLGVGWRRGEWGVGGRK